MVASCVSHARRIFLLENLLEPRERDGNPPRRRSFVRINERNLVMEKGTREKAYLTRRDNPEFKCLDIFYFTFTRILP